VIKKRRKDFFNLKVPFKVPFIDFHLPIPSKTTTTTMMMMMMKEGLKHK
jgi:hypothetical protein